MEREQMTYTDITLKKTNGKKYKIWGWIVPNHEQDIQVLSTGIQ